MMKIRSRFYKKDDMVFISHLDVIRVFERAIRRVNIPIAYTQGFNPHPIMAFAAALGLGISSEGEYIDIQFKENLEPQFFMEKLNEALPIGLQLVESKVISNREKSLMSIIQYASYLVKIPLGSNENKALKTTIENLLNRDEVMITKEKTKKVGRRKQVTRREVNIRDQIINLELMDSNEEMTLMSMLLVAGSEGNLKPEVVLGIINEEMEASIDLQTVRIHRVDLFKEINGEKMTPLEGLEKIIES
ncbi:conserved hypothetical protein [Alkaliphilus metalliredigens QYMF]|uniref:DUF2344 domain-containing protein n=1 Tax=Alkaliphilus metalliredigens (strain QYMF) TaxID=293826 RepID=A6TQJ0_ALKMQ|nr:TIGR03936 family radical SAM-associated protein [Alkaliphilus metalliredigens]ABR48458.1 conserved hypothetical protein [Alkaliphilus metalliredigens QYMF]